MAIWMPDRRIVRAPAGFGGGTWAGAAFTPADLGSDLAQWQRADFGVFQDVAGTTPATTTGHAVQLWKDKTSNARNMSSGTAGRIPSLVVADTGANSQNSVDFATTNFMGGSSFSLANPFTIFCVWMSRLTSGFGRFIDGVDSNWLIGPRTDSSPTAMSYFAGGFAGTATMTTSTYLIQMIEQTSTVGKNWKNGVQTSGNITNPGTPGRIRFGNNGENPDGRMCEYFAITRALTTTERKKCETYIGARYSVSVPA